MVDILAVLLLTQLRGREKFEKIFENREDYHRGEHWSELQQKFFKDRRQNQKRRSMRIEYIKIGNRKQAERIRGACASLEFQGG